MKSIGRLAKTGSIAATTMMVSSVLESNMPYLENADIIGAGIGLGTGVIVAYFIERLEEARQALPIVAIGSLLAFGGYQEGAKIVHDRNLQYELSKKEYSYTYNMARLENIKYDHGKYQLALREYQSLSNKRTQSNITKNKEIQKFIASKNKFIEKKSKSLMAKKYNKNDNRTRYYNSLISSYVGLAKQYKVVLPPSSKNPRSKEDWEAIKAISEVMYFVELDKLKESYKETESKASPSTPKELKVLSEGYISNLRSEINKAIQEDVKLANSRIDSIEDLKWKGIILGLISEVILAPILMWIELLREMPNPFKKKRKVSVKRREDPLSIETALDIKKEDIAKEVETIEDLAKKKGIKITKTLKRIIHVSLDVFGEDLSKMVVVKSKTNTTNLIVFDGVEEKRDYLALSSKRANGSLTQQEESYLNALNRQIVTSNMFKSKNGDLNMFPTGASFAKPFNNAIRVMKQIVSHYDINENATTRELETILLEAYKNMKF